MIKKKWMLLICFIVVLAAGIVNKQEIKAAMITNSIQYDNGIGICSEDSPFWTGFNDDYLIKRERDYGANVQDLSSVLTSYTTFNNGWEQATNSLLNYKNPFEGKDTSKGIEITFQVGNMGLASDLGAIWSIVTEDGIVFLTAKGYLGYNGLGGWYDANLLHPDYTAVKSYIDEGDKVAVQLLPDGFALYVNGELCYDQSILNNKETGGYGFASRKGSLSDLYTGLLKTITKDGYLKFGYGSFWYLLVDMEIYDVECRLMNGTKVESYFNNESKAQVYQSQEQVPVTGISFAKTDIYLNGTGSTTQVLASVQPANASNQAMYWMTNARDVIEVDQTGRIKALKNGTAHVYIVSRDGGYRTEDCIVTVTGCEEKTDDIQVKKKKLKLKSGQKSKIKLVSDNMDTVKYKSTNTSIATVTKKGVVKGKMPGKAKIVVSAGGKKIKVGITVKASAAYVVVDKNLKISKRKATLKKGKKLTIDVSSLSGKTKFKSSNKRVASVTVKGVVKAKKKGKTAILIKRSGKTVKLSIIVKKK